MNVLRQLAIDYPHRLGRVPTAMSTLFSREPNVEHEIENMHYYFTFSDEKLTVKMFIGMGLLPCITSYTFGGETIKTRLFVYDHKKFDELIEDLRQKIYTVNTVNLTDQD